MTAPRPVLLFDGECGFCTSSAGLVARWLRRSPADFAVEPWQRTDIAAYGLTAEEAAESLQWVAADGRVSSAQDAVARALLAARPWARPAGAVLLAPGGNTVAGVAYRWVSRHRHRLPGGTPACALPR